MKISLRLLLLMMSILLVAPGLAANPFLDAKDDKPVSAEVRGTEWGDEIGEDVPLTARMVTTRIARMAWGAIFKIEFVDLESEAEQKRKIRSNYFITTDDRIFLLNEEDNDAAAKKISTMEKPPELEKHYLRAITKGKMKFKDGAYETEIAVKGSECTYLTSHNSGHFTKFVWKKGVGLIEHASGYGAAQDGFRLKRATSKSP